MNLTTFYKIYYKHRFKKASLFLKLYLSFSVLVKYFINLFYIQKIIDIDNLSSKKKILVRKKFKFSI